MFGKGCPYCPKVGLKDARFNRNFKKDIGVGYHGNQCNHDNLGYHGNQWCHQCNVNLIFYHSLIFGLPSHFVKWLQCKSVSKINQLHCILLY